MRVMFLIFMLASCASQKPLPQNEYDNDLVSVNAAMNLARSSYIKGCVFQGKKYNPKKSYFPECVVKAKEHEQEIHTIMEQ